MHSRFASTLNSIVTALMMTAMLFGCENAPDEIPVGRHESEIRCPGQYDQLVTSDYYGHSFYVPVYPEDISHAMDAELLYSEHASPGKERFAVAWVRKSDKNIYFRRWDTHTKAFLGGEQLLKDWASPVGWIKTLGFDDNCQVISGETTCAWFTWEDSYGDVDRAAVGANGGTFVSYNYFQGYAPSGDAGTVEIWWGYYERKKILAYISRGGSVDRRQIRVKLLNNAGVELSDQLLYTTDADFRAYQTAVAWSSVEERWLVAWSENEYPPTVPQDKNGKISIRYVNFNGSLGPSPTGPVTYCSRTWNDPNCGVTKKGSASGSSGSQPKKNDHCTCKNIWLASSYYSSITDQGVVKDRYRLHCYDKHLQINANGQRVGIPASGSLCNTFCPITEANFWYGSDYTPFQMMDDVSGYFSGHYRLKEDNTVT